MELSQALLKLPSATAWWGGDLGAAVESVLQCDLANHYWLEACHGYKFINSSQREVKSHMINLIINL